MKKKSANLQYVEECFAELDFDNLKDSNNKKILETIQRFLNREFGSISKCVDIKIAKNDGTNIYGMMVTPSLASFNKIADDIRPLAPNTNMDRNSDEKPVSRVSEYVIEIDSKLNSPLLRLTPAEMTAMLIHEIGHIVSDSKFIEDMNLMYLEAMTKKFPDMDATQAKNDVMAKLYIFNHLTKHQLCNEVKNLAVERKADKFVIETGYGNELMTVLQKFAELYNKSATMMYKSSDQIRKDDMKDAELFAEYAKSFKTRKSFIKDIIMKDSGSIFFYSNQIMNNIKLSFNRALSLLKKPAQINENAITKLLGITPSISKKDIDEITIEVQMIEDYDDKIYLIRKINKKLDDVAEALATLDPKADKKKFTTLSTYQTQLNSMLNVVIKKQIQEKQYGVFVKYPKGYEG